MSSTSASVRACSRYGSSKCNTALLHTTAKSASVTINHSNGIAVLIAGYFIAGHWRRLGVATAAEYFELRFGEAAVRFYTPFNLIYMMVAIAVALYSIAVLVCALTPLDEGTPFRDRRPQGLLCRAGL